MRLKASDMSRPGQSLQGWALCSVCTQEDRKKGTVSGPNADAWDGRTEADRQTWKQYQTSDDLISLFWPLCCLSLLRQGDERSNHGENLGCYTAKGQLLSLSRLKILSVDMVDFRAALTKARHGYASWQTVTCPTVGCTRIARTLTLFWNQVPFHHTYTCTCNFLEWNSRV